MEIFLIIWMLGAAATASIVFSVFDNPFGEKMTLMWWFLVIITISILWPLWLVLWVKEGPR